MHMHLLKSVTHFLFPKKKDIEHIQNDKIIWMKKNSNKNYHNTTYRDTAVESKQSKRKKKNIKKK